MNTAFNESDLPATGSTASAADAGDMHNPSPKTDHTEQGDINQANSQDNKTIGVETTNTRFKIAPDNYQPKNTIKAYKHVIYHDAGCIRYL